MDIFPFEVLIKLKTRNKTCFPADGNYLLTCGSDKSLKLWSVSRGVLLKMYSGHGYEVLDADG